MNIRIRTLKKVSIIKKIKNEHKYNIFIASLLS